MALGIGRGRIDVLLDEAAWREALAAEVRAGLTAEHRRLSPALFYDAAGSALFERITALPEYYLTRAERGLLREAAPSLVRALAPRDIVEPGAGTGGKVRYLLDAAPAGAAVLRYVPIDVDAQALITTARALAATYPALAVHAIAGDFRHHLGRVPPAMGRRLCALFGSTIGNFDPAERRRLLEGLAGLLGAGDALLLGVDLVKPRSLLELAYNDHAGVTAAFNRNILNVVNRLFGGDFRPEAFRHWAYYHAAAERIEMHLVALSRQTVRLRALGLRLVLEPYESIWTESAYKFTRESAERMLEEAGLRLLRWHTDWREMFALAVAAPA